jgi:hypothetical protein
MSQVKEKGTRFTEYIGQTQLLNGVLFHYIDPRDESQYPVVESIYMPLPLTVPPTESKPPRAEQRNNSAV